MDTTTPDLSDAAGPRADAALLRRFATLPAANIGDAMDRLGVADSAIQAIWPGALLAGPAFTVWTRPGDNQGIHRALELARPGDVLVVAGGGDSSRALLGELIGERAINLGIAGFALYGAARDADALREIGMPVFARATSPAGPYKNGPFRLGTPLAFGGVPVLPGDTEETLHERIKVEERALLIGTLRSLAAEADAGGPASDETVGA